MAGDVRYTPPNRLLQEAAIRFPPESEAVVKQYVADLTLALTQMQTHAVAELADVLLAALRAGRRIFVAGNGGSSTAAIHLAADLMAAAASLSASPHVTALTANVARLTAIANDHSYDEIFSRQIAESGRPGDVLLVLTVSGHSTNLVRAAHAARGRGMTVLAALGNTGALSAIVDRSAVFGMADYGLTEDLHVAFGHMLVRMLHGGQSCRYEGTFAVPPGQSGSG